MDANLELDLIKNDYIANKCITNENYAQNLYAALCNNRFFFDGKEWSCSWRYAGGIVASLVDCNGDYMDYYCSGISDREGFVSEGFVTDEIRSDLLKLGWTIKPYEPRLEPGIYRNEW